MPDESPPDPVAALEESMKTQVGLQEAYLRQQLGNDGYEKWRAGQEEAMKLTTGQASAHLLLASAQVDNMKALTSMVGKREALFISLAFATFVATVLAVALVVWVMVG